MVDSTISSSFSLHHTVKLNNGLSMPTFGLGTWRSEPGVVRSIVKQALQSGYRHLDCAYCYGNHAEVGQGLADAIAESNGQLKREDVWITSKLWNDHHEPARAQKHIQKILTDLGVDYLDLFLIHWPVSWHPPANGEFFPKEPDHDESHSREDTWRAMEAMVEAGQVKTIGVSNFSIEETQEIMDLAKIQPAMNQSESHPYFNNHELMKWCHSKGIQFTAYSPLGNLSLIKTDDERHANHSLKHADIEQIGTRHKKSPAQVILRWHLQSGAIVIPKTSNEKRVSENADIFDFQLSSEEMQAIEAMNKPNDAGRIINPKTRKGGKPIFPTA